MKVHVNVIQVQAKELGWIGLRACSDRQGNGVGLMD